jgi:platelet-activating factor acetylhydrolase
MSHTPSAPRFWLLLHPYFCTPPKWTLFLHPIVSREESDDPARHVVLPPAVSNIRRPSKTPSARLRRRPNRPRRTGHPGRPETFFKWKEHLHTKARILSPNPTARVVSAADFDRSESSGVRLPEPNVFYVKNSAHLNQSDFGVLFPWVCKKVFGSEAPERALRLNVRAALQFLRGNGTPVARTWTGDLVEGVHVDKLDASTGADSPAAGDGGPEDGIHDDEAILARKAGEDGPVEAWSWIDVIGLGGEAAKTERELAADGEAGQKFVPENRDAERQMEGEMEPGATAPGTLEAETAGTVEQPVAASA